MTSRAVVVDTGVFGAPLNPSAGELARRYERQHLEGRTLIVAAQTVAELRFGAIVAKWGPERRAHLEQRIAYARFAPVDDTMTWVCAHLRDVCNRAGHGLAGVTHVADLWIAATAVRYSVPLVSHDGIFRRVPGLDLITELPT